MPHNDERQEFSSARANPLRSAENLLMSYSVLMSVYAKEKPDFLRLAIESMLNQTVQTDDFVLVCDGPLTPELEAALGCYILNVVRLETNQGLPFALNFGLGNCKHDIVARMDSDDIAASNRCELQLALMSEYDIVGGMVEEFARTPGDLHRFRATAERDVSRFAKRRNPFNHPTVMFRKSKVQAVGGYENTYPLAEDYHLWVRMLMNGCKGYNIPETLVNMRIGNGLYNRRSGLDYFKMIMSLRKWMLKTGFSNWQDYCVCTIGHAASCLSPEKMRKWLYEKRLRV
ncbi:MAG: glycosyltransferase [Clostridiales bacterium]|jgi:glycosyltransferase involved in cell wall biosynthesis|nr:glycosyltransferase [Clostridiales bacterium]